MGYGGAVVGDITGAAVNEAAAARPQARADAGPRQRLLGPASGAWVVLAAVALGTMVASLTSVFEHLRGARLTPEAVKQLQAHGLTPDGYATYVLALETLLAGTAFVVGAVVAWRRSDDRGALFVAAMLVTFGATWSTAPTALAAGQPGWAWAIAVVAFVGDACFFAFCYVFPDGRLVPRWTRPLAVAAVAVAFARRVFPGGLDAWPDVPQVLPLVVFLSTGIAAQVHRYRRASTPAQRQQTKWVVLGTAVALGGFLGLLPLFLVVLPPVEENPLVDLLGRTLLYGLMLLIPLSLAMAVLRYRLWDIDLVVNRAPIYGGLTAGVVALYLGVVGGLGALSQAYGSPVISFAAAGVVAVLFQPLRVRLQRGVNRLLYGERDDPYTVLSRLGDRLEATLTPQAVLPAIVDTVREALKVPYAAVALKEGDAFVVAARSGSPGANDRAPLRLPLAHQGEVVGELLLGHRAGEERFGSADRRLLDDLAHHAGVAAQGVRLSADLQRSRERLVGAREEERRRLRRDLHDGLGPALSSAMLKVGAARRQLPPDAGVDGLLAEVREDLRGVVADVRRLSTTCSRRPSTNWGYRWRSAR